MYAKNAILCTTVKTRYYQLPEIQRKLYRFLYVFFVEAVNKTRKTKSADEKNQRDATRRLNRKIRSIPFADRVSRTADTWIRGTWFRYFSNSCIPSTRLLDRAQCPDHLYTFRNLWKSNHKFSNYIHTYIERIKQNFSTITATKFKRSKSKSTTETATNKYIGIYLRKYKNYSNIHPRYTRENLFHYSKTIVII